MVAFRMSVIGGGDTQPPTVPTNLTGTAISSSQINLSWTASTDTLTHLGTDQFGSPFVVTLDPSLVTTQSLSFANVTMFVDGTSQGSGPVTTPVTIPFIGGTVYGVVHPLASCASGCVSIAVQLASATVPPGFRSLLLPSR